MRKQIKVLISIAAVVCMVAAMMIPSFAADEGTLAVTDQGMTGDKTAGSVTTDSGTIAWTNLKDGIQEKNGVKQLGLKPAEGMEGKDASVTFTFKVEKDGEYEITLGFAIDKIDGNRKGNYAIDKGEATALKLEDVKDWNVQTNKVTVELKAGEHTVTFTNDAAFDGKTVKALNVVSVSWKLKTDDSAKDDDTTKADDTTKTDDTTGSTGTGSGTGSNPTAPTTGFVTFVIAAAAIGSGAYVVSKKRH